MTIQPKIITGHHHVLKIDSNLAMVHTTDTINVGNVIQLGLKQLLVTTLKADASKYYKGSIFYEINFKLTGAR